MREPSIHITKSVLNSILSSLGPNSEDLTDTIFRLAKTHSINTRTITVSNERMEEKAMKIMKAERNDTDVLAQILYSVRKKLKHRGIVPIKAGSKDWGVLKEITSQALDFTNEFGLTRRYGFLRYIEIGLSKMQNFALNKLPSMYEGICERHQAMVEIEKDSDSTMTEEMYKYYCSKIIENTGIHDNLKEIPEKFVWFVRARAEAEKLNLSVKVYMKAQFEGLDFTKGIPHPTQLVGAKAKERVIRHCYKEGIKVKN